MRRVEQNPWKMMSAVEERKPLEFKERGHLEYQERNYS